MVVELEWWKDQSWDSEEPSYLYNGITYTDKMASLY